MNKEIRYVGIIGTAGRNEDGVKMSYSLFNLMVAHAEFVISEILKFNVKDVWLISGGSSWSDHVAVRLWNNAILLDELDNSYAGMTLFLPCKFNSTSKTKIFYDGDSPRLNTLHGEFSAKLHGENSFTDILTAFYLGCNIVEARNFDERNREIASHCGYLIAYTWGESKHEPKLGGTRNTWNYCTGRRLHFPLCEVSEWASSALRNSAIQYKSNKKRSRGEDLVGEGDDDGDNHENKAFKLFDNIV